MTHNEATTSAIIEAHAPAFGYTLLRNNVGAARDDTGRLIRFGLGNISAQRTKLITSSDWIGWRDRDGRFTAIEAKRGGWRGPSTQREHAQAAFIDLVKRCGGVAGFVTCLDDLAKVLEL
jgi:hypothetical protein